MLITRNRSLPSISIPFTLFGENSALAPGGCLHAPFILNCEDTQAANVGLCIAACQDLFWTTDDGSRSLPQS